MQDDLGVGCPRARVTDGDEPPMWFLGTELKSSDTAVRALNLPSRQSLNFSSVVVVSYLR